MADRINRVKHLLASLYTINLALDCEGAKLSSKMLATLDGFENLITTTRRTAEFLMSEGDLLFSDNTRNNSFSYGNR